MTAPAAMTTSELQALLADTDARIKEQGTLLRTTPQDTLAFAAMTESRPGMLKFRHRLDDELDRRGA